MRALAERLRLVVVTPGRGERRELEALADAAFQGGATALWVRERSMDDAELRRFLVTARDAARRHDALVLVSGCDDLAIELGLGGVHLGHRDASPADVRARRGDALTIGFSAHDPLDRSAVAAADYLTLSPVFETPSKAGVLPALGIERFAALAAAAGKPVVALGGVSLDRVWPVVRAGACGVAVMRAVTDAVDPQAAARALRRCVDEALA